MRRTPSLTVHIAFVLIATHANSQTSEPGLPVFLWPLEPDLYQIVQISPTQPEPAYVWYWDPHTDLSGYHAGEDWNANNNIDEGHVIRSPQEGEVLFSDRGILNDISVLVRYPMPDGPDAHMLFRHCQEDSNAQKGPIARGEPVCKIGDTGATNPHMHWELVDFHSVDVNPWFELRTGTPCRYPFRLAPSPAFPSPCAHLEPGVTIASYGSPSLFLDDWGTETVTAQLINEEWVKIQVPNHSPISMIHLRPEAASGQRSLREAMASGEINVHYLNQDGWQEWIANDSAYFEQGTTYRARNNLPVPFRLIIPIPGHNQIETRARMEMLQWANERRCEGDTNQSSCFTRIETRGLTPFSPSIPGSPWDAWGVSVEFADASGDTHTQQILYAANRSNPLLRCILGLNPANGVQDSAWTQIAPGVVYTTPSEPLLVVSSEDNLCNEPS